MSMSPIAHTGPHGPTRAQSFPGAHVKIGWGEVVPEGESSSQKFPSLFLGTTGAMASPGGTGALAVNRLMLSERDTQHPTAPPKQDKGPGARAALGPENREGGEAVSTPLTRTLPHYPGSCPAVPWRSALPVWPAPRARHPAIGLAHHCQACGPDPPPPTSLASAPGARPSTPVSVTEDVCLQHMAWLQHLELMFQHRKIQSDTITLTEGRWGPVQLQGPVPPAPGPRARPCVWPPGSLLTSPQPCLPG